MEMCPYCGEDVPADSARCWKCGTELTPGAGDAAAEGEEGGIEQRQVDGKAGGKKKPTVPCPHCEAPVSIYALRCNDCGRSIGRPGRRINWGKASWLVFGVVGLATLVGLIYAFVASRPELEDRARKSSRGNALGDTWVEFERVFLRKAPSKEHEARRREAWERDFQGEFVAWQGVIVELDPEQGTLHLHETGTGEPGKPHVRLHLKRRSDVKDRDLKLGKSVAYTARLTDYHPDARLLELDDGVIGDD